MSDEQRNIFGTKFTSLFSEKLTSDVRRDIREQLQHQQQHNIRVNNHNHFKETTHYKGMQDQDPEYAEKLIQK